jgi:hypothetical protein
MLLADPLADGYDFLGSWVYPNKGTYSQLKRPKFGRSVRLAGTSTSVIFNRLSPVMYPVSKIVHSV